MTSDYYISRALDMVDFPSGFAHPVAVILGSKPHYRFTPAVFAWISYAIDVLPRTPPHPQLESGSSPHINR